MICVVVGLIHTKLVKLIAKIAAIGAKTLNLLFSARTPDKLDGVDPKGVLTPGYVRARMAGSAVWRPKKMGKMAC